LDGFLSFRTFHFKKWRKHQLCSLTHKTENIKEHSYDSLLTEVNHLMDPKHTFSCFVVDIEKDCGIELS